MFVSSKKGEGGKGMGGFVFVLFVLFFNPCLTSEPPSVFQQTAVSLLWKPAEHTLAILGRGLCFPGIIKVDKAEFKIAEGL